MVPIEDVMETEILDTLTINGNDARFWKKMILPDPIRLLQPGILTLSIPNLTLDLTTTTGNGFWVRLIWI